MKTADLFENYDLFDVRDFGKVSAVLHVFILFWMLRISQLVLFCKIIMYDGR